MQNVPLNWLAAFSMVGTVMVPLLKSCLPATPFFQRQIGSRLFAIILVAWTTTSPGLEFRQVKPVGDGVLETVLHFLLAFRPEVDVASLADDVLGSLEADIHETGG